jgi:hypothetical protein
MHGCHAWTKCPYSACQIGPTVSYCFSDRAAPHLQLASSSQQSRTRRASSARQSAASPARMAHPSGLLEPDADGFPSSTLLWFPSTISAAAHHQSTQRGASPVHSERRADSPHQPHARMTALSSVIVPPPPAALLPFGAAQRSLCLPVCLSVCTVVALSVCRLPSPSHASVALSVQKRSPHALCTAGSKPAQKP